MHMHTTELYRRVSPMKQLNMYVGIPLLMLVASVAGCGGGDDAEAGSPTAFAVVPSTFTLTAPTVANGGPAVGTCVSGDAGTYYIYGGAAPYRLDNTMPSAVILNKSTVDDAGGSFSVILDGREGCVKNATVVITDKLNNRVLLTLNNSPST
jgi:hypothetical protein